MQRNTRKNELVGIQRELREGESLLRSSSITNYTTFKKNKELIL